VAPSDSKITLSVSKPWSAEHALTGAFACALIEKQFPELKPVQAQYLGAGWDNTVFLINETWVFRFPRRSVAVALLGHEKITLNALQDFPLDYPQPVFYGQPDTVDQTHYPWPFLGYRKVAGQTACGQQVSAQDREAWVSPLALALKHLHAQPIPEGLPGDLLQRSDLNYRLPRFRQEWAETQTIAAQHQESLPTAAIQKLLKQLSSLHADAGILQDSPTALLHGDLYVRHLMLNKQHQLTGFIDWGDTHHGDIATDLGIVYSALPPALHSAFWQVYGPVNAFTRCKAQLRGLYSCMYIYRYGLDIHDTDLVREGRQGMQWIASLYP
jgi:aminoglycoside phosphotransferase (APT) family kinase protein